MEIEDARGSGWDQMKTRFIELCPDKAEELIKTVIQAVKIEIAGYNELCEREQNPDLKDSYRDIAATLGQVVIDLEYLD